MILNIYYLTVTVSVVVPTETVAEVVPELIPTMTVAPPVESKLPVATVTALPAAAGVTLV